MKLNRLVSVVFATFALCGSAPFLPAQSPVSRLPRTNLLVFHDRTGALKTVTSPRDWLRRRAEILQGVQVIMGALPDANRRCPLAPEIDQELDGGSYTRLHLTYAAEPGSRVPAYLLVPKAARSRGFLPGSRPCPDESVKGATDLLGRGGPRLPAVLALHPTDMDYGNRVVIEPLRASYRAYAADLAQRGYVVLAPAYPLLADYCPDLKALGYQSGTMKAIWDNIRGLDLLDSLPYVRHGRYGVIGHSLGGHNAIYTAVFDRRIKVAVSSCGFDSFLDYKDGHIEGWTSERYMPALLAYRDRLAEIPFDFYELIGASAPINS